MKKPSACGRFRVTDALAAPEISPRSRAKGYGDTEPIVFDIQLATRELTRDILGFFAYVEALHLVGRCCVILKARRGDKFKAEILECANKSQPNRLRIQNLPTRGRFRGRDAGGKKPQAAVPVRGVPAGRPRHLRRGKKLN
ncbi:hypothetical protein EVAR_13750_1 [Eumeta japonica]|uniref:Uncharacterized protein n=1 Tax=Eumeta variegata TaxID=151549 RepID=A0A4C1UCW1_EUMVA|nr:hypothetical protein EVAR_13750_1 [Eumeta japonica]